MRRCSKCGELKLESEFAPSRPAECRTCRKKYAAAYYATHREQLRVSRAIYRATHREQRRAYSIAYRVLHKEQIRVSNAAYHTTHLEQYRVRAATWCKTHPETKQAQSTLNNAIKAGNVIRPTTCPVCGKNDSMIEAHHPDYTKPLDVIWLCSVCHTRTHKWLAEEKTNARTTEPTRPILA